MCSWVGLVERLAGPRRVWDAGFQYGDWLDPAAPPDAPEAGRTAPGLVATAYFARSAELLARVARELGRADDAARFDALAADVRDAFRARFLRPDGRLTSDSPTAYALALRFDLLDADAARRAGDRLVELVSENDFRISTGYLGTPVICDALCSVGADDAAYALLLQRECPSWLYPLTMGATTIWERWDSLLPDGRVNPGEMTSFNHYAYGAIADWMHRTVAGLAPAAPGYRRLEIRPRPGGGLTYAHARHRTPYGVAEAGWRVVDGGIEVRAVVPPSTTAVVVLPGADCAPFDVGSGSYSWLVRAAAVAT
jgi:alpha-L-rhamnosidase